MWAPPPTHRDCFSTGPAGGWAIVRQELDVLHVLRLRASGACSGCGPGSEGPAGGSESPPQWGGRCPAPSSPPPPKPPHLPLSPPGRDRQSGEVATWAHLWAVFRGGECCHRWRLRRLLAGWQEGRSGRSRSASLCFSLRVRPRPTVTAAAVGGKLFLTHSFKCVIPFMNSAATVEGHPRNGRAACRHGPPP